MDILKYKGYEGTADLDMTRMICRGKILFINDLVTYEATSPAELQAQFEAAVDDYVETCQQLGREPQKPLKGQFNVRVAPELHKAAILRAAVDRVSLNDVVVRALDAFVNVRADVNHNVHVTLQVPEGQLQTIVGGAEMVPTWGAAHVH